MANKEQIQNLNLDLPDSTVLETLLLHVFALCSKFTDLSLKAEITL